MKKVISISTDRNIFREGSAVRARQIEYGALFEELHIVIFTRWTAFLPAKLQIAPNVWVYGTRSLSRFFYTLDAAKVAGGIVADRKLTPQNAVVTTQDPFEAGLVGAKLNKKFGLPLHVQIHTDFLSPYFAKESLLNNFRVGLARSVLPKADAVRVVSRRITAGLTNLKPSVVPQVLPIFVDLQKGASVTGDNSAASPDLPPDRDLKKKYPQFNFIILMASRLTREKNLPFALVVFKKLRDVYPKIGLVMVGTGPEQNRLKSLAKKLGVAESVVFEVWQDDLAPFFATANLFLMTSNYEGYGLTLVEATAAHCPVVSTDVGVASELLGGMVCPVGDLACFLNKISALIENPGIRANTARESFDRLAQVTVGEKAAYLAKYQAGIEAAAQAAIQAATPAPGASAEPSELGK